MLFSTFNNLLKICEARHVSVILTNPLTVLPARSSGPLLPGHWPIEVSKIVDFPRPPMDRFLETNLYFKLVTSMNEYKVKNRYKLLKMFDSEGY